MCFNFQTLLGPDALKLYSGIPKSERKQTECPKSERSITEPNLVRFSKLKVRVLDIHCISLLRHQTWASASQRCQPLRMAGLVLPEANLQDLFAQMTPFAHSAKMPRFLLVEMSLNSVAYFEDLMSDIFGNYLLRLAGFE